MHNAHGHVVKCRYKTIRDSHYQKLQTSTACCIPALLEFVFRANFDSFFNRHSHLYHTCTIYRGWGWWGGGGWGGWRPKKLKNSADLVAVHLPRWNRPKREESTMDRMAILPMAAMPTKKHGTLVRPHNHPPSSHSRR